MTTPLPTSLERFGDELNRAAHRELSISSEPARARGRRSRPRLLAGGTLGLAGVGAALVLALSAGGAAARPAFAITTQGDGSLAVNLHSDKGLIGVNRKLAAMGTNEHINFQMAQGPAAVDGAVNCVPSPQARACRDRR